MVSDFPEAEAFDEAVDGGAHEVGRRRDRVEHPVPGSVQDRCGGLALGGDGALDGR